jgi:GNAT superfamily N-acetyltransferase
VTNRFNESVGETDHWTEEMLAVDLRHPTHVRPEHGMLLAFVRDRLVAYSSVEYADTTDGERHYRSLGNVDPEWQRRGLGSAMMAFNEGLLRDLAARERYRGRCALLTWVDDLNAGGTALARQRGYRRTRVFHHMTRPDLEDIDIAPLPAGIEVRPMTRELLPRYWAAAVEAFSDHYGGHDFSAQAFQRFAEDPLLDLELFVTAFEGDEIVASVQGVIDAHENEAHGYLRGWTDPVFTRRAWRRRGLAHALLGRSLQQLKDRGMTSAQLGVDSENENRALTLYERHGYAVDRSTGEWQKPLGSTS